MNREKLIELRWLLNSLIANAPDTEIEEDRYLSKAIDVRAEVDILIKTLESLQ